MTSKGIEKLNYMANDLYELKDDYDNDGTYYQACKGGTFALDMLIHMYNKFKVDYETLTEEDKCTPYNRAMIDFCSYFEEELDEVLKKANEVD